MSLVDPKHLIAPFKNTVHLIAIIFIVLLFAVYRLATGGVEIVPRSDKEDPLSATGSTAAPSVSPGAAKEESKGSAQSSDLNEIEKALGLSK